MSPPEEIRTTRLLLRRWIAEDRIPFAALNADPRVVEFLPAALRQEDSDALIERIEGHFEKYGFGLWAGLSNPRFEAPFIPCVEIGLRLAADFWGRGYATEAALAALAFGFEELELEEIVSFTVADNVRSRRVMEKIGMARSPKDDFDHPELPEGHRLRQHVLYRIKRPAAGCS